MYDFKTGMEADVRDNPTRMVRVTMHYFAIVLYGSFCAGLTTLLSTYDVHLPFETMSEFYHNANLKIGTIKGIFIGEEFEYGDQIRRDIFNERWEWAESFEDGLNKTLKEDFVFVWDELPLDIAVGDDCSYSKVVVNPKTSAIYWMINKNTFLKPIFDH